MIEPLPKFVEGTTHGTLTKGLWSLTPRPFFGIPPRFVIAEGLLCDGVAN